MTTQYDKSGSMNEPETQRWFRGPLVKLGWTVAILIMIIDQLHKWWMIHIFNIAQKGNVKITDFLDLVMVWNKGVSYGLFPQETLAGRLTLVFFAAVMVIALSIWLAHIFSKLEALAVGLVMGGAIGNAIDRLYYGAVADFFRLHLDDVRINIDNALFSLHINGLEWFVFNIADMAIFTGAVLLVILTLFMSPKNDLNPR